MAPVVRRYTELRNAVDRILKDQRDELELLQTNLALIAYTPVLEHSNYMATLQTQCSDMQAGRQQAQQQVDAYEQEFQSARQKK